MKQLDINGFQVVHNDDTKGAGIVIINTCGFIKDAKEESINTILHYIKAKQQGIIDWLIVMGCLSQRYRDELRAEMPEVDEYFGSADISSVVRFLGADYRKELVGERLLTTPSHYAYLKISEGCDRRCSFCAIPLMRGRHRSKAIEDIEYEACKLAGGGVKELILIAQDLTYYGVDLYHRQKLSELLNRLSDIRGLDWIRLHYAYPANFPFDILPVIRERENICNYIDIPFQHISDKVLKLMKRRITKQQIYDLIEKIRSEIPGITLRTTLMTGHPGEDQDDFDQLRQFVSQIQFDRLGVFTYSQEEDTWSANNLSDNIPEREKQNRANLIMKIQNEISAELNDKKTGSLLSVLIDRVEGEYFIGRTEADSPEVDNEVLIRRNEQQIKTGKFYTVKITSAMDYDLYGEIVQ